jgi:hypothetical protein
MLHAAPWRDEAEVQDDPNIPLVNKRLAGDFLCMPFGRDDVTGDPPHGATRQCALGGDGRRARPRRICACRCRCKARWWTSICASPARFSTRPTWSTGGRARSVSPITRWRGWPRGAAVLFAQARGPDRPGGAARGAQPLGAGAGPEGACPELRGWRRLGPAAPIPRAGGRGFLHAGGGPGRAHRLDRPHARGRGRYAGRAERRAGHAGDNAVGVERRAGVFALERAASGRSGDRGWLCGGWTWVCGGAVGQSLCRDGGGDRAAPWGRPSDPPRHGRLAASQGLGGGGGDRGGGRGADPDRGGWGAGVGAFDGGFFG